MTERELTDQMIALARLTGWRSFHVRQARTKESWRTPVQGDGKGFPDLLLLRGGSMIVAELKVGKNALTYEQEAWLGAFQQVEEVRAYTWRDEDWNKVEKTLR